jgi:calcium-dependent protein kinase
MLSQISLIGEKTGRVADHYQISQRLGKGAYSEVYLAKQKISGMIRCIKVTRKKNLATHNDDLIFDEVKILKEIDHPNIMKIYEYYQDAQNIYIVSECLGGGELFDRIVKNKYFGERDAASLMAQILSAVSYLHKHNIIHRDLKPENIVFESASADANLKIIDFGTSKKLIDKEILKTKVGTAYYIAPEVLRNNCDYKCDIWSCGVILYILLCGYPPFNDSNDNDIFKRILHGKFDFPQDEWSHVSNEAKDVVTRMLTYDQSLRPSSEELLRHPWFGQALQKPFDSESSLRVLKNFNTFYSNCRLQKAILIYFVNFFDIKEEKMKLLEAFKEFDKDHDGQISKEELILAYRKFSHNFPLDEQASEVLQKLDFNNSSAIDFSEFLVANVNYLHTLNKQRLRQIFDIIDRDGSGFLTIQELKAFLNMGGQEHEEFVKSMITEVDKNKDGVISFDEFDGMMNEFFKRM